MEKFAGIRQWRFTAGLVVAVTALGCSEPSASELGIRVQLSLNGPDTLRSRRESRVLKAAVLDDGGAPMASAVTFASDNPDVLTVLRLSPQLLSLEAVADGKARITATLGDVSESIDIIVRRRLVAFRLLAGLADGFGMTVGGIHSFEPVITDSLGFRMPAPAAIAFSTGDSTVAYLNSHGQVTALRGGRTFITGLMVLPESTVVSRASVGVSVYPQYGAAVRANPDRFVPDSTSVPAGIPVTWLFPSGTRHGVVFDRTGALAPPADITAVQDTSVQRTFPSVGKWTYRCILHPSETGTVVVRPY